MTGLLSPSTSYVIIDTMDLPIKINFVLLGSSFEGHCSGQFFADVCYWVMSRRISHPMMLPCSSWTLASSIKFMPAALSFIEASIHKYKM